MGENRFGWELVQVGIGSGRNCARVGTERVPIKGIGQGWATSSTYSLSSLKNLFFGKNC